MSDEVNYVANWEEEATQCKNCKNFQSQKGKNVCVPEEMSFEEALAEYGEVDANGHCNFFEAKK